MAGRTLALSVTSRAEVALRVGLNSVLSKKVAVVDQMALWRDTFRLQFHVAAIAVTHVPLPGVLVAAEACRHVGSKGGVLVLDVHVAANADPCACLGVAGMGEAQMLARHLRSVARPRAAMAIRAGVRVVRVFMALDASLRCRKMQRAGLTRVLDARVTLDTVDSIEQVRSMLERALRRVALALEPENLGAGARRARQGNQCQNCDEPLRHFFGHCPW
jgi:hypothetical protein